MSKIYTVNDDILVSNQIPSIEYINEIVKLIQDEMSKQNKDFNGFPSIKTNTEKLPIGVEELPIISAKDIKTDSNHKFISDGILSTIVDKPSKFELEKIISELKRNIKEELNNTYMKIINTPNVINKLRDISNILNEDKATDALLNVLAYKLNINEFEEHIESVTHMSNNDRKALNILIKCLKEGFADWTAEDNQYNCIKNKPVALPADGGNADTVNNHGINDLINKYDYDVVIGTSGERYSKDSCDLYAENGIIDKDKFSSLMKTLKYDGIVLFKRGLFKIDNIDGKLGAIIFEGMDRRLSFIETTNYLDTTDYIFKNIGFVDSKIIIGSGCEITNASFNNCDIVFDNTMASTIMNCNFYNCRIEYKGSLMNNIIKFNRFTQTNPIKYIGGNNIISENI